MLHLLIIFTSIISLIIFLHFRINNKGLKTVLAKLITSILFILFACYNLTINQSALQFSILIIIGLVFSSYGDIFLDLKYIYLNDKDLYLFSGFISFIFCHIFYISAINTFITWEIKYLLLAFFISIISLIIIILMEKPLNMDYGRFKFIAVLYGFILTFTAITAFIWAITVQSKSSILMAVGSLLFLLSDFVLSGTYFGQNKNTPFYIILNHILYYSAQFIIGASILFI